ncbi:unnamed protein product [Symbiodinium sp. CCMP2456]|nr:unnamed protein product [Symbiodinium sp. CCMP2456]
MVLLDHDPDDALLAHFLEGSLQGFRSLPKAEVKLLVAEGLGGLLPGVRRQTAQHALSFLQGHSQHHGHAVAQHRGHRRLHSPSLYGHQGGAHRRHYRNPHRAAHRSHSLQGSRRHGHPQSHGRRPSPDRHRHRPHSRRRAVSEGRRPRGHMSPRRRWRPEPMEAGFVAARGRRSMEAPDHARSKYGDASTSFEGANGAPGADNGNAAKLQRKAQLELKIKELDRQIEEQRSQERALAEQEEQHRKDMGNTAILTPTQEKAALQSREVGMQQDAVSDKTEQLVKEKLELLKELEKIQIEEGKGKPEEEITPGETVTREIVGPAGEKEIEVVKEEEGGKEEVEEVKEETPEEAKQMKENGGQIVSPPPAPPPEVQEAEAEMGGDGGYYGPGGPMGAPEPVKCPPCPPLPKARERMLMVSAEDEPPGKAPKVEVDVTESAEVPQQTFLFAPPAASVKNVRLGQVDEATRQHALFGSSLTRSFVPGDCCRYRQLDRAFASTFCLSRLPVASSLLDMPPTRIEMGVPDAAVPRPVRRVGLQDCNGLQSVSLSGAEREDAESYSSATCLDGAVGQNAVTAPKSLRQLQRARRCALRFVSRKLGLQTFAAILHGPILGAWLAAGKWDRKPPKEALPVYFGAVRELHEAAVGPAVEDSRLMQCFLLMLWGGLRFSVAQRLALSH